MIHHDASWCPWKGASMSYLDAFGNTSGSAAQPQLATEDTEKCMENMWMKTYFKKNGNRSAETTQHHITHMFSRFFSANPKAGDWQKATSDGAAVQGISLDLNETPENSQRWVFQGYLWVSGGSVANLKHRTAGKLHQVLVCFFVTFRFQLE